MISATTKFGAVALLWLFGGAAGWAESANDNPTTQSDAYIDGEISSVKFVSKDNWFKIKAKILVRNYGASCIGVGPTGPAPNGLVEAYYSEDDQFQEGVDTLVGLGTYKAPPFSLTRSVRARVTAYSSQPNGFVIYRLAQSELGLPDKCQSNNDVARNY